MSYVQRTNPSLQGMGCNSCGGNCDGMNGLGMNTYAEMSWNPPSQSSFGGYAGMHGLGAGDTVYTPGTAANTLATTVPDTPNPTSQTVFDAFSNSYGGAQPGVLPLYPNITADGLSFVKTPPQSTQCKVISTLNENPLWFVGGALALFYFANQKKGRG